MESTNDLEELKKKYEEFRSYMWRSMANIGLDHRLKYCTEQYFEDFEKSIKMDEW